MTGPSGALTSAHQSFEGKKSERPLSIVHIVAPAPFGGLESVLRGLAAGHTKLGHSVVVAMVLSPGGDEHPFGAALEADGVAQLRIRVNDRDYAGERRAVRELCRSTRPDVVHTHGFRPDVVDGALVRGQGIPVVSTCHGFIDSNLRGRIYQWVQRRALRDFDAVIAVSEQIARRVRAAGVATEKVHLIRNVFVPTAAAFTREEARMRLGMPDVPTIGWIGRLSTEKGPDVALEAFARLERPNTRLVIIGGGPDESSLRRQAEVLGVADRVLWRGVIPDAGRLLPAFDAFLLSSRTEGTPVALLEAMANGVPIVATSVGGVPDTVDPSSALLVASGATEEMAAALGEILDGPDLARERAQRARSQLDEHFNVRAWLSRYESVYRQVMNSPSVPAPQ